MMEAGCLMMVAGWVDDGCELIIDDGCVGDFGLCWVCERVERSVKEIIKNCKKINILLNRCIK